MEVRGVRQGPRLPVRIKMLNSEMRMTKWDADTRWYRRFEPACSGNARKHSIIVSFCMIWFRRLEGFHRSRISGFHE